MDSYWESVLPGWPEEIKAKGRISRCYICTENTRDTISSFSDTTTFLKGDYRKKVFAKTQKIRYHRKIQKTKLKKLIQSDKT